MSGVKPGPSSHETHGPIPAFDHQLKTLGDSYLSFMTERVRIEDQYVAALSRLHRNIRAVDNLLDDRDPSSVRVTWRELRDNVEREAEARTAFANTIRTDVLPPLKAMREEQERTRKRIYEDLRVGTAAHIDYLENGLPRLKRHYLKKCQEVEDYRAAERPTASTTSNNASGVNPSSQPSLPPGAIPIQRRASFGDREKPYIQSPTPTSTPTPTPTPSATALIQSVSTITLPPSTHQPAPRNRSPSSANMNPLFSDLAHHGKKGLGQLIGFLEPGRDREKDRERGLSTSLKENGEKPNGLKGVRAKREADEADKEYRKGVHWLETLRLRRVKRLQAGANSLETFVSEFGELMKKALTIYADCVSSTASICSSLANHGQTALTGISIKTDSERVHNFVEYAFLRSIPPQVYYWNYQVGECKDLIFGFSLVDYATDRGIVNSNEVPSLISKCITEIEMRGMDVGGIYRVSGRHALLQEFLHKIERDERSFEFKPTDDIFAVSGLLKMYLRELPEPVFRFPLLERVQHTKDREEHIASGFRTLRSKIRRLPFVHQVTLRALLEHLARVAANSNVNKMDSKNLAIVFGAVIFGEDEMPKGEDVLSVVALKDTVMEDLITYVGLLFEDPVKRSPSANTSSITQSEPPLPNPPPEEPLAVEPGSAYTKVTTLPPRKDRERDTPRNSRDGEDFTPRLPAQPQHSIHPSRARLNLSNPPVTTTTTPTTQQMPLTSSSVENVDSGTGSTEDVHSPQQPKPPSTSSLLEGPVNQPEEDEDEDEDEEEDDDDDSIFEPYDPPPSDDKLSPGDTSDGRKEFISAPSSPP
ncbi:uncharacterized protein EI90DRAFT_2970532 [Cantharellus anzutake]|uniref:uncharacterized protein n=1 Tax=Cantharellus anzutake TaxID=1750568 RepID=UPI0019032799|nr:uncharacterized protein EI90DRAFT_2970532 [Cantharellus anzutake]KAF8334160.1 hypothetical protein EI90DRAFT_2970532 [Cantharellus anzutake]